MVYLKVKENSAQAKLMIEYLKTLSFVEVIEEESLKNESDSLTKKRKKVKTLVPNNETIKAIKEAREGKVNKQKSTKDLFSKLKESASV